MKAQIRKAINNLYDAYDEAGGKHYTLRIKGKKLPLEDFEYNPLAVGDYVEFTPYSETEGLITARLERKSAFVRWNVKLEKNQTIAANMDQVAIITSAFEPPFRPRFLDRAISCVSGSDVLIVMNKLKIDRRAVACALGFGLRAPYVTIPFGFGGLYHGILSTNITENGMEIGKFEVWQYTWPLGLAMLAGLIFAVLVLYRKPREYKNIEGVAVDLDTVDTTMTYKHWMALVAAVLCGISVRRLVRCRWRRR